MLGIMSVSDCQALNEWRHGDVLGLDCGNVMSQRLDSNGYELHTYSDFGLYAFLLLYKMVFGLDHLVIVSRVNTPVRSPTFPNAPANVRHWVRRFVNVGLNLFHLGMPEDHLVLVNEYHEKGPAVADMALGAFIDDHMEALMSIRRSHPDAVLIKYDNTRPGAPMWPLRPKWLNGDVFAARCADECWSMENWYDLAWAMNLPFVDAVFGETYTKQFPPHDTALHSEQMDDLIAHLQRTIAPRPSTKYEDWVVSILFFFP